jgi:hypothetical protein
MRDGFLPVPHEMFAALMLVDLTCEARMVLCEIVAQRYGPAKREGAKFKQSELAEQLGVFRSNIARGLRALLDRGIVVRHGKEFRLVTDYDAWTKKGASLFTSQRADYIATAPGRAAAELFAMRSRSKARRGRPDSSAAVPPLDGPLADLIAHRNGVLRSMSYAEYLQTPHWAARRDATLKAAGGRCRVCNSPDELNVHHRTYERFGDEADDDLLVLCRPCHQLFHESGKLAKP